MIEVALIVKNGTLLPHSKEDQEALKEFNSQLVKAKISGTRKARSYDQLKAYWACCRAVADNTENINFNTPKKCDLQLRVSLGWIEDSIVVKDKVQFLPKSISYKTMSHLAACNYFDRAFETMAKFLKCTVEEMLECAE